MSSDSARTFFKLKGMSSELTGAPGWYVWLEDVPGAYGLEMPRGESG